MEQNNRSVTSSLWTYGELVEKLNRDRSKIKNFINSCVIKQKDTLLVAKSNLSVSPFEFYLDFLRLKPEEKIVYFGAYYERKEPERKLQIGQTYIIKEFTRSQITPVFSPITGDIILSISKGDESQRITSYKNFVPDLPRYARLIKSA